MTASDRELLEALCRRTPLCLALVAADGRVELVSRALWEAVGLEEGAPAPPWIETACATGHFEHDGRQFEVAPVECGEDRLVLLRDRTEEARMEERLWDQQARLSKAYSELVVRNQALARTADELRAREAELAALNRGLEDRVREQVERLDRSERLRHYLSPDVAEAVLAGDVSRLAPKKRVLTLLVADVAGFDELVADMESEEIVELISRWREAATRTLFARGGTLDRFAGARMSAFFGDPIPHEDHARRAVEVALELRERLASLAPAWFGAPAKIQAGVLTGWVTVGNVGSAQRLDYTVIGKNVELASSLQQEARPGQVLLTVRTHEAVRDLYEFETLHVVLKGSSRPVLAYSVRTADEPPEETIALAPAQVEESRREAVEILHARKPRKGHYALLEKLAEGGMGVIYKALDERLQRMVALKVLSGELASSEKFLTRFRREARTLASLSSPHIAQVYDLSEHEVPPYFAMELVEGSNLAQLLEREGRLPLRRALDVVLQAACGLRAAAEKGVIHRDVKPSNIMITPRGQVKLVDFGIGKGATGADPTLTTRGVVLGTPHYMSPEQIRGLELDPRSDIYSLGAVFWQLLAGVPPYCAENSLAVMRRHTDDPVPPFAALPSTVSPQVYQVLQRMLAKRREDRYADWGEAISALESC